MKVGKKVGIVTFHNVYNYGGLLQAYALCKFIGDATNYDVECIDYRQESIERKYSHKLYHKGKSLKENIKHFGRYYILRKDVIKESRFRRFSEKFLPVSAMPVRSLDDAGNKSNDYDILISGSDQIWNPQFTGGKLDPVYFLNFGNKSTRRISFASSAGAYNFKDEDLKQIESMLSGFERVSVREEFLKAQLTFLQKEVQVVVDPTLLLGSREWAEIEIPVPHLPDNFVLLYTFDNNPLCIEAAENISNQLNIPVVAIWNQRKKHKQIDYCLSDPGPGEFTWLFHHAKFVITNSFHGTAFAINFNKSFYSIYKNNNPFRVINLLKNLKLEDRLINSIHQIEEGSVMIDFIVPNELLRNLVERSGSFLIDAIEHATIPEYS